MKRHLPILALLIAALALRLVALDAVRAYHDFAVPHSLGIGILESIADGRFADLPVLGIGSGARLKNPIAASYLWAIVEIFDRDPYSANVVSVLLSVLGVAMVFDLGRRLFSRSVGCAAAVMTAASPWGIFYARGTWVQGQLEFASILAAWFVLRAMTPTHTTSTVKGAARDRMRRALLLPGLVMTAITMQTYLMTMALLMPVSMVGMISLIRDRSMLRPFLAGIAICSLGALMFLVLSLTHAGNVEGAFATGLGTTGYEHESSTRFAAAARAVQRTLEDVGGRGFNAEYTVSGEGLLPGMRITLSAGRALIVEALLGFGVVVALLQICIWRGGTTRNFSTSSAQLLAWLVLPIVLATLLNFSNLLALAGHYMLITQPAAALLAGLPFMWLDGARTRMVRVLRVCGALAACASIGLSGVLMAAHTQSVLQHPHLNLTSQELLGWYPLRTQRELARLWRAECREVASETYGLVIASVLQTTSGVRQLASRIGDWDANRNSSAWEIRPDGGTCATRAAGPAAPWSDQFAMSMPDGINLITYRSKPVDEVALLESIGVDQNPGWRLNIGWTYLGANAPLCAHAGDAVSITQVWRIDDLPNEPYLDWQYATHARLRSESGKQFDLAGHIWLPAPEMWRTKDYVLQTSVLALPPQLAAGDYVIELSIYDERQKKNAVYFDSQAPNTPILAVSKILSIEKCFF